jgi:hypothetical protein
MEILQATDQKNEKHTFGNSPNRHKTAPADDIHSNEEYIPENPTLEELLQTSSDIEKGNITLIPWEQVKAGLDAIRT